MKRKWCWLMFIISFVVFCASSAKAHCEIPCGIYDDEMRLDMISEHVKTIEKSMNMILDLQKEENINYNQLVRWIDNKEHHATEIQDIANQYFLVQRIKFDDPKYVEKLKALHDIIVYAMKCKQNVDLAILEKLRNACRIFENFYRE